MRTDWNRARFKETGKAIFLANYWPFVGVLALLLLLSGNAVVYQLNQITNDLIELFWVAGIMEPVPFLQRVEVYTDWVPSLSLGAGFVIALLVAYPYEVGVCRFLLENSAGRAAPSPRLALGFGPTMATWSSPSFCVRCSPRCGPFCSSSQGSSGALGTSLCPTFWRRTPTSLGDEPSS